MRFAIVESRFAMACAASRAWDELAGKALAAFGDHGPLISGCCRDHFPADVKEELRTLARLVGTYADSARAARPKGVRHDTIRAIGRAIARRDGSGRYGPQP